MPEEGKHISLREAAQISGYAPDYVGQLIRSGKLPGKQVYANVAWVTTESALREYLLKQSNGKREEKPGGFERLARVLARKDVRTGEFWVRALLYLSLVVSAGLFLFLFFVFSVQLNKKMESKNTLRAGERNSATLSP